MNKEKRKKLALVKRIVLAILIVILLLLIAVVVIFKVFTVENVKVEGNELYDKTLIEQTVLNDEYSWNSLYVLIKYTFTETQEVPFIDTMEVSLEDPHTLHIKVYEKGILGYLYIPSLGENAYFDKDGIVVETSTRIIEDVPMVKGLECDEVVLYDKLPIESTQLKQLLTLTQTLKRNDLIPDTISYTDKKEAIVYYGNIRIELGTIENLTQKVSCITGILPKLDGLAGTLHLEDWSEENTNYVFEKEE